MSRTSFFDLVHRIAGQVETLRARDSSRAFEDVATEVLREAGAHRTFDTWTAVRELFETEALPPQVDPDSSFSDLPLTLYRGDGFHVDLLHWLDGTTEIHEHAFSGAFQVLAGSSLHVGYRFRSTRQVGDRLLLGELTPSRAEVLQRGDVVPIRRGGDGIHSLFHLDAPSVTLVVRTSGGDSARQLGYVRPNLALDVFAPVPDAARRRIQAAELLYRAGHPDADAILAESFAPLDLEGVFQLLRVAYPHLAGDDDDAGSERFEHLLQAARTRHGDDVDLFRAPLEEEARQLHLIQRRRLVRDPELRFFLALLLNAPGRLAALDLVRARHPGADPVARVVGWLETLIRTPHPERASENVLGVEGIDDGVLRVFRGLLEGLSVPEIAARAGAALDAGEVGETAEELRESWLFRSILAG